MHTAREQRSRPTRREPATRSLRAIVAAGLLLTTGGCHAAAAPRAAKETEGPFGRLERVEGVPVLTLWGSPYQRGYAHGRLLAPAILEMVDVVCGSHLVLGRLQDYERVILPLMKRFKFAPDEERELRGIFEGVRARLGPGAKLKRLGRPLTLRDLRAYNTAGDWYRQACSTFAAWGTRTQDGHVWVGRNFDFLPAKEFYAHQMVIVRRRAGARKAWAAMTAPGLIGCITGINEDRVFLSVHDVFLPLRPLETGYTPRLLVLRRLMETCAARDLVAQALPILEAHRQMFDNAVLLAAPVTDGTPPAVVFEYNNDYSKDKGVTVRRPADNQEAFCREMIACTNHFRKRVEPRFDPLNYRYPLLRRLLMAATSHGGKVGLDVARKAMAAARLPITVHTAIVDLNTLECWFAPGKLLAPPRSRDFVKLPLKAWLAPK